MKNKNMNALVITPSDFLCHYCVMAENVLKVNGYRVRVERLDEQDLRLRYGEHFEVPKIHQGACIWLDRAH